MGAGHSSWGDSAIPRVSRSRAGRQGALRRPRASLTPVPGRTAQTDPGGDGPRCTGGSAACALRCAQTCGVLQFHRSSQQLRTIRPGAAAIPPGRRACHCTLSVVRPSVRPSVRPTDRPVWRQATQPIQTPRHGAHVAHKWRTAARKGSGSLCGGAPHVAPPLPQANEELSALSQDAAKLSFLERTKVRGRPTPGRWPVAPGRIPPRRPCRSALHVCSPPHPPLSAPDARGGQGRTAADSGAYPCRRSCFA